jgi:hypothetical protein
VIAVRWRRIKRVYGRSTGAGGNLSDRSGMNVLARVRELCQWLGEMAEEEPGEIVTQEIPPEAFCAYHFTACDATVTVRADAVVIARADYRTELLWSDVEPMHALEADERAIYKFAHAKRFHWAHAAFGPETGSWASFWAPHSVIALLWHVVCGRWRPH